MKRKTEWRSRTKSGKTIQTAELGELVVEGTDRKVRVIQKINIKVEQFSAKKYVFIHLYVYVVCGVTRSQAFSDIRFACKISIFPPSVAGSVLTGYRYRSLKFLIIPWSVGQTTDVIRGEQKYNYEIDHRRDVVMVCPIVNLQ